MNREARKELKPKQAKPKFNSGKLKARLASAYYGSKNNMKDMKLIAITGSTGKVTVAHFVHEIMKAAGLRVAVFASDEPFHASALHKFLSDAWKAEADFVIVTTPVKSLKNSTFFGLPVYVAAMTNFITSSLSDMTPEEYLDSEKTLFNMDPKIVVMNSDDLNYPAFSDFHGKDKTLTYGSSGSDVKILNSKLYKKGVEATFSTTFGVITVASFLTGETIIPYMAAATAIALGLRIDEDSITNGIAAFEG